MPHKKNKKLFRRFLREKLKKVHKKGFTLIELLIVISVIGVLAGVVLIMINPLTYIRRARDTQRKSDIHSLAERLLEYEVVTGRIPGNEICEGSIGILNPGMGCTRPSAQNDWDSSAGSLRQSLVSGGYVKKMPLDPLNNTTYYYSYVKKDQNDNWMITCNIGECGFWIGAKLEKPDDPSKTHFQCTNLTDPITGDTGLRCSER